MHVPIVLAHPEPHSFDAQTTAVAARDAQRPDRLDRATPLAFDRMAGAGGRPKPDAPACGFFIRALP